MSQPSQTTPEQLSVAQLQQELVQLDRSFTELTQYITQLDTDDGKNLMGVIQGFTPDQIIDKVRMIENYSYNLGVSEARQMQRGRVLNILGTLNNPKQTTKQPSNKPNNPNPKKRKLIAISSPFTTNNSNNPPHQTSHNPPAAKLTKLDNHNNANQPEQKQNQINLVNNNNVNKSTAVMVPSLAQAQLQNGLKASLATPVAIIPSSSTPTNPLNSDPQVKPITVTLPSGLSSVGLSGTAPSGPVPVSQTAQVVRAQLHHVNNHNHNVQPLHGTGVTAAVQVAALANSSSETSTQVTNTLIKNEANQASTS